MADEIDNETKQKDILDLAVRTALEANSKSAIMFLLRERMIREIVECVTPIIVRPYVEHIAELEAKMGVVSEAPTPPVPPAPPKVTDKRLLALRETLEDMAELTDDQGT